MLPENKAAEPMHTRVPLFAALFSGSRVAHFQVTYTTGYTHKVKEMVESSEKEKRDEGL